MLYLYIFSYYNKIKIIKGRGITHTTIDKDFNKILKQDITKSNLGASNVDLNGSNKIKHYRKIFQKIQMVKTYRDDWRMETAVE